MTVDEVADWVAYAVQLPQYSEIFRANSISGYTFPLLMANDGARMQEIGVHRELHRHQLAMFLQMKYLGMGRKPKAVASSVCTTGDTPVAQENVVLQIAWVPAENTPQRYQLQRRSPGESIWELVFTGADTEVTDVVKYDRYMVYRLTTWNSYGRSPRTYIHCDDADTSGSALPDALTFDSSRSLLPSMGKSQSVHPLSSQGRHKRELAKETSHMENAKHVDSDDGCDHRISTWSLLKIYFWWLDDAIIILLVVMLPIRGIIYGDADLLLRLLRRLPPNMPTRVTVEMESTQATVGNAVARISWEKPVDNGVPIVCYTVRWTRTKTEDEKCTRLLAVPLPTTVTVEKLSHGETYKFVVQATNQFGLVTSSSRSTYMVPIPELKGKLRPQHLSAEGRAVCNQCHVCHDPRYKKKVPFTATLDRRILHYCCSCDKEFCHYHKGEVHHSKAVSCPIVDGRCICITCNERRLRRTVTN
uniref:Fibronectin type-III domain-containing protein n=1 Tax=Hyaloperonospora arabidopsidis (strain Emoy2) TaxID=559515 RepID=M4B6E3_HYAAE